MRNYKTNGCVFEYQIQTDAFTQEKYIYWEEININDNYFCSDGICLDSDYFMSFDIRKKEDLCSCNMKLESRRFKLHVGDTVSFLFSDDTISTLTIADKIDDEFVLPIEKTDFIFFAEKELNKVRFCRVKDKKTETLIFDFYDLCCSKKKESSILLNEYTKLFLRIAKEEFGWEPKDKVIIDTSSTDSTVYAEIAQYCYVYLMIDRNTNLYKIGMANNPNYREKTLQSEKPAIEKICEKKLPSREYACSIEKMLHTLYASKRVRGEWFELNGKELWEITEFLK